MPLLYQSFVCESCGEIFKEDPHANAYCQKCSSYRGQVVGHILCEACRFVHSISAAQESYYFNGLESDPEFYRFR